MSRTGRAARWGLLGTALVLGATLLFSTLGHHMATRLAADALQRGQMDMIVSSLPRLLQETPEGGETAAVARLLEELAPLGLEYAALVDAHGTLIAQAGRRMGPPPSDLPEAVHPTGPFGGPAPLYRVPGGFRVRVPSPLHRVSANASAPNPLARLTDPGQTPGGIPTAPRTMGPTDYVVLDVMPSMAQQLMASSHATLVVGLAAALILMGAAVVFWRLSLRADALELDVQRQQHLAALGEMSAVLAHEIRNPLASLKGNAQILEARLPAETRERSKAALVVREAVRLEKITTQLLDFVRSGRVDRGEVDPVALARECAEATSVSRVDVLDRGAPPRWHIDAIRMRQVLDNLVRNAIQASPPEGRVELCVGMEDGQLCFEVRDHGAGIPLELRQRIFEPFSTTRTQGVGLGLAISRRIVESHGGRLSADNHPEGGARFRVHVPHGT